MRRCLRTFVLALFAATLVLAGAAAFGDVPAAHAQEFDTEVPPGNPVIGDGRPGDIQAGDNTNYALWGLFAVCLIGAGVLLVNIERWEARRIEHRTN